MSSACPGDGPCAGDLLCRSREARPAVRPPKDSEETDCPRPPGDSVPAPSQPAFPSEPHRGYQTDLTEPGLALPRRPLRPEPSGSQLKYTGC